MNSSDPKPADVDAIRAAYADFLDVAAGGGFGAPPAGEWDAEHVLAHVSVAHDAIASVALAVTAGQRVTYDNRASLAEHNLRRVVDAAGGLAGCVDLVRRGAELYDHVARRLTPADLDVAVPVFIVSGDEIVVDQPWSLRLLVEGISRIHLPRHADQLRSLR